jgi:acetolactate synthase-1/2/3 large subunit
MTMNGAESLVKSLLASDVDVCFTNPGTSEMHFVAALDHVEGMRCVLALHENVATGAADGYYRMKGKPACTLLHLGPGLANGLSNLHNAKKAGSGVVNIVGEHAASHVELEAPLYADIEGIAGPMSAWVHTSHSAADVGADAARAVAAARMTPGQVATLVLPSDTAWNEGGTIADAQEVPAAEVIATDRIEEAAKLLDGPESLLLIGQQAVREENLELAGRIAARTGCHLLSEWGNAVMDRGAGRVKVERVPYPIDIALETLAPYKRIVLLGARAPIGFFAYPGKPARLTREDATIFTLADRTQDVGTAMRDLCAATVAANTAPAHLVEAHIPEVPEGPLGPDTFAPIIAAAIPKDGIVVDESITTGRAFFPATAGAAPHVWINNLGGSIGYSMPNAIGCAIACPDRKVLALTGDGSAMYAPQSLWTMARENLDICVVIWANRSYRILRGELTGVGVQNPGPRAIDMLSLDRPQIDFAALARGQGVEAEQVTEPDQFAQALARGIETTGPYLIEAIF